MPILQRKVLYYLVALKVLIVYLQKNLYVKQLHNTHSQEKKEY
jgi:hypothetical protein